MIEDKEIFLKQKNDNIITYLCDRKKQQRQLI